MTFTRRDFLYFSGPLVALPILPRDCSDLADHYRNREPSFMHGVASGDSLPERVVLWTRVSRDEHAPSQVPVTWVIAKGMDITTNPFDPSAYDRVSGAGSLAVELVTPAVTSPGIDDPVQAAQLAAALRQTHPHIKFVELNRRGYALLDITHERVQCEWYHVETIFDRRSDEALATTLQVRSGENHLSAAAGPSLPLMSAPALAPGQAPSA